MMQADHLGAGDAGSAGDPNTTHSVLRERIVEHLFVGEVLRRLWIRGVRDVEILRSEFDAGGYDLVMSRRDLVRHIQFKTTMRGSKVEGTNVSLRLAERPSGCVIWIVPTPDLRFDSYLWFGDEAGCPLPDITAMPIAKHTKSNSKGTKLPRQNLRTVARRNFAPIPSLDDLLARLLGNEI